MFAIYRTVLAISQSGLLYAGWDRWLAPVSGKCLAGLSADDLALPCRFRLLPERFQHLPAAGRLASRHPGSEHEERKYAAEDDPRRDYEDLWGANMSSVSGRGDLSHDLRSGLTSCLS